MKSTRAIHTRPLPFAANEELARLVGVPHSEMDCYEIAVEALRVLGFGCLPTSPAAMLAMSPKPVREVLDDEPLEVGDVFEIAPKDNEPSHLAIIIDATHCLHARGDAHSSLSRIELVLGAAKAAGRLVRRWRVLKGGTT